ncbi:hypothetical protein [Rhizobium sp. SGZ-381]|uniref:hypothetical protein n=1 Tax=Rhizobium sp. SGZ-381 TaxID=3342800 RepID=UPI0036702013
MTDGTKPADLTEFDLLYELESEIIAARALVFAIVDLMGLPLTDLDRRATSIGHLATLAEEILGRAEQSTQPLHVLYFSRMADAKGEVA